MVGGACRDCCWWDRNHPDTDVGECERITPPSNLEDHPPAEIAVVMTRDGTDHVLTVADEQAQKIWLSTLADFGCALWEKART